MSSTVKYVIVAAITLAIAAGLVTAGYSWGKSKQANKDNIVQSELVHTIDSLENIISTVESATIEYSMVCDSLQLELERLSIRSQGIQQYYDAKIRDIAYYNDIELQRFFTERYNSSR